MNDPHALLRRAHAIDSVKQVLKALAAVSRAQLPGAEQLSADATTYLDWIDETLDRVTGPPHVVDGTERLSVLLGPERSFCGPLVRQIAARAPKGALGIVGTRLRETCGEPPLFWLRGPTSASDIDGIAFRLSQEVTEQARGRQVELYYPVAAERLHRVTLLAGERRANQDHVELLSPPSEVIAELLIRSLSSRLIVGLAETLRVELAARVQLLDGSCRAADEQIDELHRQWQQARQGLITNEINEIVAGSLATSG